MSKTPEFSFTPLSELNDPARLEDALVHAEQALGVRITVSDHAALFLDDDGRQALPAARRRHEIPYCNFGRERPSWDRACLSHCGRAVPLRAGESATPFLHQCWKGAEELVVPVFYEDSHACTLFAGLFAGGQPLRAPLRRPVPAALSRMRRALPSLDLAYAERLAGALQLLGAGLVGVWVRRVRWGAATDRAAQIRRFLHLHAHENIRLVDLARHLSLSPSRTGALVRRHLGRAFQEALHFERLRRAQTLLKETRHSVKEIAARTGFSSEYYFNRVFRKSTGQSPGRWRKGQAKGQA